MKLFVTQTKLYKYNYTLQTTVNPDAIGRQQISSMDFRQYDGTKGINERAISEAITFLEHMLNSALL